MRYWTYYRWLRVRVYFSYLRSDHACVVCNRNERPWRQMMVYPLLAAGCAYICSDACWDRFRDPAA